MRKIYSHVIDMFVYGYMEGARGSLEVAERGGKAAQNV
jgi:hypothetical protein